MHPYNFVLIDTQFESKKWTHFPHYILLGVTTATGFLSPASSHLGPRVLAHFSDGVSAGQP